MEGNTHLKNAMSATATITLNSKDNVLLVSVDAVETVDGQKYVQVVVNTQSSTDMFGTLMEQRQSMQNG